MSRFSCEVAVVGGGLAGCSAALHLAQRGVDVALFEAGVLPRHRVCGEFLSPESRATLARLGVLDELENAGARQVQTGRFCCAWQSASFDLGKAAGLAISRLALDPILFGRVQLAGARAFLGAKTRQLHRVSEGFEFEAGAEVWRAQSIIVAAGRAKSPKTAPKSPRFCGFKAHFESVDLPLGEVEMHLFGGGYCGIVRVEGEATNVCLMARYGSFGGGPDVFWPEILRRNPQLAARFGRARRISDWQSTGNVSFGQFRPLGAAGGSIAGDGIARGALCAGDAAGYIHPLTGDGMAMALRAGELAGAAAALVPQGTTVDDAAREFGAVWRREFGARLRFAAGLHPFALRPQWARPILPVLERLPPVKALLVRATRGII